MQTRRDLAGLAGLLAAEAAALVALVRLGARDELAVPLAGLRGWITTAAPADAVVAALRIIGLGCAGWLLLSTLAYTGTRLARVRAGRGVLDRMTLPVIRRIADRAVAVVLATSGVWGVPGGAAWAADPVLVPPGAQVTVLEDAADDPVLAPPGARVTVVEDAGDEASAPAGAAAIPSPTPVPGAGSDADVWVVAPGQHLWGIARSLLDAERASGAGPPTDREVHARWLELLEANVDRLASGDPDRIHPGEELLTGREPGILAPPGAADGT